MHSLQLQPSPNERRDVQAPRVPGPSSFCRRALLASSIMLSCASLSSLPSCSGKVAGDERPNWVPAYTFSTDTGSGNVAVSARFAGMEAQNLYGVTRYYGRYTDIPDGLSSREQNLASLIFAQLGHTFDFTTAQAASMLGNDILVFMTDPNVWPNAIYSQGLPSAYGFQVLERGGTTVSDCRAGPCIYRDLLAINNKDSFFPEATSIGELTPAQMMALKAIADSLGEEILHDYWLDALDSATRSGFTSAFRSFWRAGSPNQAGDAVIAEAWLSGGAAYALQKDGSVNAYALKPSVESAIAGACPECAPDERKRMEIGIVVYLQLFGDQADSFMAHPSRSYYEYYVRQDKSEGKPTGSYEDYLVRFIERESFSHIGAPGTLTRTVPSFFRALYFPICTEAHLNSIFSDGSQAPEIANNTYLSEPSAFLALIQAVMPQALSGGKGQ